METTSLPVRSSPERATELFELIKAFRIAQDAGDRFTALRLIDRAWRIASNNPEINYLYGLWLVKNDSAKAAISLLEQAAAGYNDPNIEAVYISALCANGDVEQAHARLQKALLRFALTADSPLADTARQVASACQHTASGWIGIGLDLKLHGEIVGERGMVPLRIVVGESAPHTVLIDCTAQPATYFHTDIDVSFGGGTVQAAVHDLPLLGSGFAIPPDFGLDGRATPCEEGISGWAVLRWDPTHALAITLSGEQGLPATVMATPDPLIGRHYFAFDVDTTRQAGNSIAVTVMLPDGQPTPLPGSPFLIRPPTPINPPKGRRKTNPASGKLIAKRSVDVVIPVYAGLDETLNCIKSVQKTIDSDIDIIVIDDASPDPRIRLALDALARTGVITLLRNETNLGFPGTVNRGLTRNADRDAVILNSDTEVYGDWLVRLRAAAYSGYNVGTVTPMTNSGSIASYPISEEPDLNSETAAGRDALAARLNAGKTVDIPTGVGFCLYLRRDCIAEVGLFDTETFSKGYGEENDFCLRATEAGWRHLLTGDTYIRHIGSKSFGGLRAALFERNIRLLNLRYSSYEATIRAYGKTDAAHDLRRRLDEARLIALGGRSALLVSLGLYGGVRRAVDERVAQLRSAGMTPILLKPDLEHAGRCVLSVDDATLEDLYFDRSELDGLIDLLHRLELDQIEVHHILDVPGELIDRLYEVGPPVDIQVHDYIWYCPRINLLDEAGRYCGEPAIEGCRSCVEKNGSLLAEDIEVGTLRTRSARWLRNARHVSVPSESVAKRMAAAFPEPAFDVRPLEDSPAPAPFAPSAGEKTKVALIGAIGAHKGFDILMDMAKDAVTRDLPLEFVVIGYSQDDKALTDTGRVFVTGEYDEHELEQLVARENPDVALFLSQFPETWCYSLTHALNARIPVAGYDFGAIGDRLSTSPDALLFPRSSTATELCDRLLAVFHPRQNEAGSRRDKTDILTNEPALPMVPSSRRDMTTSSNLPSASVEFLPLAQGLYVFAVKSTQPAYRVDEQNGISLPAIQLSNAPGQPANQIELMLSPRTPTAWLSEPHDQIVVKVNAAHAVVLLTTVIIPGMAPLEIEVQRLDRAESAVPLQVQPVQSPVPSELPPLPAARQSLPIKVIPHVQNHGDLEFQESQWAGRPAEGCWIESFSISPLAELTDDMIEYKAVTATGVETPWVSGASPCGTRGIGVPLIGLAIRIKPQAKVENGMCEYGAMLLSGKVLGPARNGMPCRSTDSSDPICGIWISISGKSPAAAQPADYPAKSSSKAKKAGKSEGAAEPSAKKTASTTATTKTAIGPRFSAFREQNNSEQE